ncbi:glycerate kinase [Candidatus Acidianus copahuensis]|uniref:Glycerate kinase n=1 Tax=Candidatus Acidianus copahuensis TaxID=1160895 RepID=A0A031LK70_9CREN|nr:glycerate kinase [Candidatus Acidianus copahuensis]
MIRQILRLADPYTALSKKISLSRNSIKIENFELNFTRPLIIAVGKASYKMAKFFLDRVKPVQSLVVSPYGTKIDLDSNVIYAGHPQVDENSIKAGEMAEKLLKEEDYDVLFFLLSGGASALMEVPVISLNEYRKINDILIKSGLGIKNINIVRKHLSKLKGGKLAMMSKAPVVSLIISDVPGNNLDTIGSGYTVADSSTVVDASKILNQMDLSQYSNFLIESPKQVNSFNFIVLDNMDVLKGLRDFLPNPLLLTSEVSGEAKDLGKFLASIHNSINDYKLPFEAGTILIGGEPEVTISGKSGKGGRNGEVALSFLKNIRKKKDFTLYAIATDGIDGNSEYAGCILKDIDIPEEEINAHLKQHSSYELLEKYSLTVNTGPTYTNVNNIYILIES